MDLETRQQPEAAPATAGHQDHQPEGGQVAVRQAEAAPAPAPTPAQLRKDRIAREVLAGYVFGILGAAVSLAANVIGALAVGKHPLELLRVLGTFPFGPAALDTNDPLPLTGLCILFLGTGMLLGVPFQLLLSQRLANASVVARFLAVSGLALLVWGIGFYGILSWLQPLLYAGDWILAKMPWWVAALTHLAFGWTILAAQPLRCLIPHARFKAAHPA